MIECCWILRDNCWVKNYPIVLLVFFNQWIGQKCCKVLADVTAALIRKVASEGRQGFFNNLLAEILVVEKRWQPRQVGGNETPKEK